MAFHFHQQNGLPRWNRILLSGYWGIVIASIALSALYNLFTRSMPGVKPVQIISLNTVYVCFGLLFIEAAHRLMRRGNDYIVILGGGVLALGLIGSFPSSGSIVTTLFLPILASIFYFQHRKLLFSFLLSLLVFALAFVWKLQYTSPDGIADWLIVGAILTTGYCLGLGIISRGAELLKILRSTMASEQDLLVKNILMDKMAKTDALTGLYNHMSFHEHLENLIVQGERNGLTFQLALLDIDHFKKVNDTYGHRAGDVVLMRVAGILQEMVSLNEFPARYGGEEFAILFTEMTPEQALEHLEQIRLKVASVRHEELNDNPVTISIGLNSFVRGCTKEELFTGADDALYQAKREGRNRTVVYQADKSLAQ